MRDFVLPCVHFSDFYCDVIIMFRIVLYNRLVRKIGNVENNAVKITNFTKHQKRRLKLHYHKSTGDITQNVKNESTVTRHLLNTQIRQLPGSGRVVTTGYPNPVSDQIRYASHL